MLQTLGDYACTCFRFEDRNAIIVFPKTKPNGNWALKTEYWTAFPETELLLLEQGFHVAYLANKSRLAPKSDCDAKARFVDFIAEKYGLKNKCVPIGMSCGGAHAVRFAGYYPEKVACMYIDAPVLNYCDFPGKPGVAELEPVWENEFKPVYPGVARYQLLTFPHHPINMTDDLIKNRIPVVMVYGTDDTLVHHQENALLLEEAMAGLDFFKSIPVPGRGHHPHSIFVDNRPVVDFILAHCE